MKIALESDQYYRFYTDGGSYRYTFNGQEQDNEVNDAAGTSLTAEYWQYDSRLGRRWNLDPEPVAGISHYVCFGDNPILYQDQAGNAWWKDENGNIIWIPGGKVGDVAMMGNIKYTYMGPVLKPADFGIANEMVQYTYNAVIGNTYNSEAAFMELGYYSNYTGTVYSDGMYPGPECGTRRVHQGTQFIANDKITPQNFYDIMMCAFQTGLGPENWYFGEEHSVSKNLATSIQVNDILNQYYSQMRAKGVTKLSELTPTERDISSTQPLTTLPLFAIKGELFEGTPLTTEHFLGSVSASVTPDFSNNTLVIQLFNITSLGSGSFPGQRSFIRPTEFGKGDSKAQPFTNISQTFVIRVPMNLSKLNAK